MAYSDLLYEERGAVACITFNRPDALNALRGVTIAQLHDVLERVAGNAALRVVVFTGAGRAFSSGRDLKEQDALTAFPPVASAVAAVVEQYQELTRRLTRMDQVVISAINGAAVGLGAELAAASDIRLASTAARIAFPEVRRALFLTNGVVHRLPRIVGLGRAADWILSGRMIDAAEMLASGFVSRVNDAAALLPDALQIAGDIAAHAPISVRMAKDLLNRAGDLDLETILGLERDALVRCVESADYREGVRAFLEKRAPDFIGQ